MTAAAHKWTAKLDRTPGGMWVVRWRCEQCGAKRNHYLRPPTDLPQEVCA